MAVPESIHKAVGLWRGKSRLHLPFLPPEKQVTESDSVLHIETDAAVKFATITYDWRYEGTREEGTILLAAHERSVQLGWVDSWHQNEAVMHLKGEESGTGSMKVRGEFGAGGEVWGWTIELVPTADRLTLRMENVSPAGEAVWAVDAVYTRE